MNKRTANWISYLVILSLAVMAAVLWDTLPDPIPSHWNAAGEVDDTMPKLPGTLLLVVLPLLIMGVFRLIPLISPQGFRIDQFMGVLYLLQTVTVLFTATVSAVVLLYAIGIELDMTVIVTSGTGLLLVVIGNQLGKVRKNFFIGIRTPWTLASDEVWAKTHRLGGWLMVIAGLVMCIGAITGLSLEYLVIAVVVLVLVPVVYSYFAYRRIEGFRPDPDVDPDKDQL